MNKNLVLSACLLIAIAILLGAFGAHSLKKVLDENALTSFETGVRYQLFMGFGLILQQIVGQLTVTDLKTSGRTILVGTLLFSSSIYLLVLFDQLNWWKMPLVPLTPIGGSLLIIGWLMTTFKLYKANF